MSAWWRVSAHPHDEITVRWEVVHARQHCTCFRKHARHTKAGNQVEKVSCHARIDDTHLLKFAETRDCKIKSWQRLCEVALSVFRDGASGSGHELGLRLLLLHNNLINTHPTHITGQQTSWAVTASQLCSATRLAPWYPLLTLCRHRFERSFRPPPSPSRRVVAPCLAAPPDRTSQVAHGCAGSHKQNRPGNVLPASRVCLVSASTTRRRYLQNGHLTCCLCQLLKTVANAVTRHLQIGTL